MKKIEEGFKGIIMGVANVIPGLSGGTIAVVMGIYEKLINALADFLKSPIKSILEIWQIALGIVIGIVLSALGISYMLENYEIQSTMLFVGFILGSVPVIVKKIENKKFVTRDLVAFVLFVFLVMLLPVLEMAGITANSVSMNILPLLIVGILASATMIVPGISGSMLLMTLGYYDKIMKVVSDIILSLKNFDISSFFSNIIVILPFGIGVLIGIFLIAKIMRWLIAKYEVSTNWAILGLIVASPFAIISKLNLSKASFLEIVVSIFTFIIGYIIAYMLCKFDNKKVKKGVGRNEKND